MWQCHGIYHTFERLLKFSLFGCMYIQNCRKFCYTNKLGKCYNISLFRDTHSITAYVRMCTVKGSKSVIVSS